MLLRGLVLSVLFSLEAARRSLRIDASHHDAQQQTNTLASAREARQGWRRFDPLGLWPRRARRRTTTNGPVEEKPGTMVTRSRSLDVTPVDGPMLVDSGSLRTWLIDLSMEQVQVFLSTDGDALDTDIELWHGKGSPVKIGVYASNGKLNHFSTVIAAPGQDNTVSIRNIGQLDSPITADVVADNVYVPSPACHSEAATVQGAALHEYPVPDGVERVQVLLRNIGQPLNARVELLQGPDDERQVVEIYTEDGMASPFFCILETPGSDYIVRVANTANVESALTASVVPDPITL